MTQRARELSAKGSRSSACLRESRIFQHLPMPSKRRMPQHLPAIREYPPMDGTAALKAAIAGKFKRDNNLDYDASQIVVSGGGKQVIFNAMLADLQSRRRGCHPRRRHG